MTAEQVIALADRKAREAGEPWTFGHNDCVRCPDGRCPLEVAASVEAGHAITAGARLQMDFMDRWQVMAAADNDESDRDFRPHLRALMLATFDFAEGV